MCPSTCAAPGTTALCQPWGVSTEGLAKNGGKCPACCHKGKYYTRMCDAVRVETSLYSSSAPGCIEVLHVLGSSEGHFEAVAENLRLPFVFAYFESYAELEAEAKRRLDAGRFGYRSSGSSRSSKAGLARRLADRL